MEPPTVDDILAHYGVTSAELDKPCSDMDIAKIAGFLVSWREVAPHLGLSEKDEEDIKRDMQTEAQKKKAALRKWRSKFGHRATYKVLVAAMVEVQMVKCAENVCQVVKAHCDSSTGNQSGANGSDQIERDVQGATGERGLQVDATVPIKDSSTGSRKAPHQSGASGLGQVEGRDQCATGGNDPQPVAAPVPASFEVETLSDEESWRLSSDFAAMMKELIPLMDKALKVEDLKEYLELFCDVRTGLPYIEPAIYKQCASTAEILKALHKHLRFHSIQVTLLKNIVERYGCDESKHLLGEYESKIPKSKPLKWSRNELTDEEIQSIPGTRVLKVEIKGDCDTCSLNDVERIAKALARSPGVDIAVVVYAKHEPGSVILTFIIPKCTVGAFIHMSKKQRSDLATEGVLSIAIGLISINLVQQKAGQPPAAESEAVHQTKLTPAPSSEDVHSGGGALQKVEATTQHQKFSITEKQLTHPMRPKPQPWEDPLKETSLPV